MAANVAIGQSIASGTPIEIAFDRLLLPSSTNRQTFIVQDLMGSYQEPAVAYDPVSRVVRLCVPLEADQSYKLTFVSPQNAQDPNGLRAIDGALLGSDQPTSIEFPVIAGPAYAGADACPQGDAGAAGGGDASAPSAPVATPPPPIDFCSQVLPIFASSCGGNNCHGSDPAAGLELTSSAGIAATAIGRVAQGSNTGSQSTVTAAIPGHLFGVDMAIVAPGDPANSWLLYKVLMADPPPCAASATSCTATTATVQNDYFDLVWPPLTDDERATLASFIPGREMPYPADPSAPLASSTTALTLDQMDLLSLWVLQGATVQTCSQ